MVKVCTKCGVEQPFANFDKQKQGKHGLKANCKSCRSNYNKTRSATKEVKEYAKFHHIYDTYKLTKEEYLELAKDGCNICGSNSDLVVDHDHNCCPSGTHSNGVTCGQCIRGILCRNCNSGIGKLKDNPELVLDAYSYLMKYKIAKDVM